MYLISIGAGVLVGVIYALINVRSPAPPAIALLGLLGMLIGEQMVPIAKRMIEGQPLSTAWFAKECAPRITGLPPAADASADAPASPPSKGL